MAGLSSIRLQFWSISAWTFSRSFFCVTFIGLWNHWIVSEFANRNFEIGPDLFGLARLIRAVDMLIIDMHKRYNFQNLSHFCCCSENGFHEMFSNKYLPLHVRSVFIYRFWHNIICISFSFSLPSTSVWSGFIAVFYFVASHRRFSSLYVFPFAHYMQYFIDELGHLVL